MDENRKLYEIALTAKENAYAPYSGFKVGAAVLTDNGIVYTGCNVENSSYGAAMCAERTAIAKAVSEGSRNIVKIAVASDNNAYTYPCGICRQVISEFMPEGEVIIGNDEKIMIYKVSELLPHAFTLDK